MRIPIQLLFAALIGATLLGGASSGRADEPANSAHPEKDDGHGARGTFDAPFAFDAAARFNETLLASIDTVDATLAAILVGDLAASLFAFDKLGELQRPAEICAVALLACSVLTCAFGYFVHLWARREPRDGIEPRLFIPDLIEQGPSAVGGALKTLIEVSEVHMSIRIYKRVSIVAAIVLSIAGVVVIALARWIVQVVH